MRPTDGIGSVLDRVLASTIEAARTVPQACEKVRHFYSPNRQSSDVETLDGLVGDRSDQLVDVQHREFGEFCGCGDEQIGNGRCSVLAAGGKQHLNFYSAGFNRWCHVFHCH